MSILRRFLTPLSYLIRKDIIVFQETHHGSGSNVFALYSALHQGEPLKYECCLVDRTAKGFKDRVLRELLLMRAKWIIQDHGGKAHYPRQKVIELWHGIPLKAMDSMDINNDALVSPRQIAKALPDVVLSSSRLYETLLSACRFVPASRYRRFGFPRMRWLQTPRSEARRQLSEALGQRLGDHEELVLWMPTHRKNKSNGNGNAGSAHGPSVIPQLLETYLNDDLECSLEANNAWLVLKPHPNDEESARKQIANSGSRILLLTSDAYRSVADDLYCLLPATDALITDYSSVYFDYLLLDKPIGFIVNDLEQYRQERGFLLEPVTRWMPGPRMTSPLELIQFLNELQESKDCFKDERDRLLSTFYPDGITDSAEMIRRHLLQ